MRLVLIPAAAIVAILATGPASASPCTEQIAALEARLDEKAETAISTSSSGQGVAGAREGQAMQAEREDVASGEPAVPFQDEEQEAQATQRAADAGGGGDLIMQAKATLNRARMLDRDGDIAGCEAALAEAQKQLEGRP